MQHRNGPYSIYRESVKYKGSKKIKIKRRGSSLVRGDGPPFSDALHRCRARYDKAHRGRLEILSSLKRIQSGSGIDGG